MRRKRVYSLVLVFALVGMFGLAVRVPRVEASGTIYIRSDGRIDPSTANIVTTDKVTYTMTGDIFDSIVVQRNDILVNGAFHILQGDGGGYGIRLYQRLNVTIENMTIRGFDSGIDLAVSSHNVLSDNNVTANNNGLNLAQSGSNILSNNNVANNSNYGIVLGYSSNCFLSGNVMEGNKYGLGIFGGGSNSYRHSIGTTNLVNGKPIYYFVDQMNIVIDPDDFPAVGFLGLVDCLNMTVHKMTLIGNGEGLLIAHTNDSRITDNILTSNSEGIRLDGSFNNIMSNNTVSNNGYCGLGLQLSGGNTLFSNNVTDNGRGIFLWKSSDNMVYHNNFVNNDISFEVTQSPGNTWDDGNPSGGNYWSDYLTRYPNATEVDASGIGDTSYFIATGNIDNYPLMNAYEIPELSILSVPVLFMAAILLAVYIYGRKRSMNRPQA